jgi:phosphatidylethanolamine-binding protein (PEBP) family uncharacterized protein
MRRGTGVLLAALWSVLAQHGFVLTSPTIPGNGTIPAAHTCDGANVSPALNWFAAPAATRSYAVVLADNDVASGTVIHWIAYDLPPTLTGIPEHVGAEAAPAMPWIRG